MSLSVLLDSGSYIPPYEQIRTQIAVLIETGALAEGDRLPTVRQLAGDLRVAPGTVARTYKEMEAEGLVVTRRGAGTRVAPRGALAASRRAGLLTELVSQAVKRARALGFADAEIAAAVTSALELRPEDPRT